MSLTKAEQQELAKLRAENAALKAKQDAKSTIAYKVSAKCALSVYGLGRFPTTLYKEQRTRLLDAADGIRAFIAANDSELRGKDDAKA